MNEYTSAFESFNNSLSEGQTICNGEDITIYSAKSFYEIDEVLAEESFYDHLDSEGLELLVSLEDCLNSDVSEVLENQIVDSFINGQKKQAIKQLENLNFPFDFILWLEGNSQELEILRTLAAENYWDENLLSNTI